MDNNNESEKEKQYSFMRDVYNSLNDANKKLD